MPRLRTQLQETLGPRFALGEELGRGGMSRVFLAEETEFRRKIVVKILPLEMKDAVSFERFRREIQLAASLQHPLIVPVFTAGESHGMPYYTMPYVHGISLRERLDDIADVSIPEAIGILGDVAKALAYAHAQGIVHRDVKPENVLLAGDTAVVADFGVAKALASSRPDGEYDTITHVGVAVGTPTYMSPEQAAGHRVDHRADLYSLGVMAYEVLTGRVPFEESTTVRVLMAHVRDTPRPVSEHRADIPPALARLVMRCLSKDPNRRPQGGSEIAAELQALGAGSVARSSRGGWLARLAGRLGGRSSGPPGTS